MTGKKSLQQVPGVSQARIDFASKTVTVAFEADRTSADALVRATTDARLPSSVRK